MSIRSIKNRARKGSLEVEHLIKDATYPNEALALALDELTVELQWSFSGTLDNGSRIVPLAMWAKVVSTYCRDGFKGLVHLAAKPEQANFVIGLLEEIREKKSLDALLEAFKTNLSEPCRDLETSNRIAQAVNILCSFEPIVVTDTDQAIALRAFLATFYTCAGSDAQRAVALLALRGVGDESSAEFAASKCLGDPWRRVPRNVSRYIINRLHQEAGTNR